MDKSEKLTPREWFENTWYHYKWLIIFGGVFVVFILISLVQLLSTKNPDVDILFVGPTVMTATKMDDFENSITLLSEDYDGDGEVRVNVLELTVPRIIEDYSTGDFTNYDQRNSTLQRFQTEIRAGDAVIYILDREFFDICVEEKLLTPISEIIDDAYMPKNVVSDYGIPLSELDSANLAGFDNMPKDLLLCIRRSPEKDDITYGRSTDTWDGNRRTFVSIVKYKASETKE